jgi:hypothetical protein
MCSNFRTKKIEYEVKHYVSEYGNRRGFSTFQHKRKTTNMVTSYRFKESAEALTKQWGINMNI